MIDYIFDPLYGKYTPPELIKRLILTPEFQRLREVRLSNINSMSLIGWSNQSRYEHSLGVAYLANLSAQALCLDEIDACHLVVAGLLHDIATPPFSHTTEQLFKSFGEYSHEKNSRIIIEGLVDTRDASLGRFSQFFCEREIEVHKILKEFKVGGKHLSPSLISDLVQGKTTVGSLIKKDLDLDNLDSVYRNAYHIGLHFSREDPKLISQSYMLEGQKLGFKRNSRNLINKWISLRKNLYLELMTNPMDFSSKCMLNYALEKAYKMGHVKETDWHKTDNEMLTKLEEVTEIKDIIHRLRVGALFTVVGIFWIRDRKTIESITTREGSEKLDQDLKRVLGVGFHVFWILDDGKLSRKVSLDVYPDVEFPYTQAILEPNVLGSHSYGLLIGVFSESYSKGIEARAKVRKVLENLLGCSVALVKEKYAASLESYF